MYSLTGFINKIVVFTTAQFSYNWNKEFAYILKDIFSALPIPYSSDITIKCNGQEAQLWFEASVLFDKDMDFLNSMEPVLENINFSVNLINFQIPSKDKYYCKVAFITYTFEDLLLFNFSKIIEKIN